MPQHAIVLVFVKSDGAKDCWPREPTNKSDLSCLLLIPTSTLCSVEEIFSIVLE